MSSPPPLPAPPPPWRSSYVLGGIAAVAFAVFLGAYACDGLHTSLSHPTPALCRAVSEWRTRHGASADLQVVGTRVTFRGLPGNFSPGDAVVVAPTALNLPGAQDLLEVDGDPSPLRRLNVESTAELTWEYAGGLTRELVFDAWALVRRSPGASVTLPKVPSFDSLPQDVRVDALLSAAVLEERHLAVCKPFVKWAHQIAGEPPYTSQVLRIVQHVGSHLYVPDPEKDRKRIDDACAGIREDRFTEHQAHVVAVLAGREVGAPTLGLLASDPLHSHLVATYVDGIGWIHVDVAAAGEGFRRGGPALVGKAPIVGRFEAALDDGWNQAAAAWRKGQFGTSALSSTEAAAEAPAKDTTTTWSRPLGEVCP